MNSNSKFRWGWGWCPYMGTGAAAAATKKRGGSLISLNRSYCKGYCKGWLLFYNSGPSSNGHGTSSIMSSDFNPALLSMVGFTLEEGSTDYKDVTLADYMGGMYNEWSIFFIGDPAVGKTQLCHFLAMLLTAGKGKEQYGCAKGIDPYGAVTKAGKMCNMGAFVFNDCPLRTMMSTVLDNEDLKMLFDCREQTSIRARYNVAAFPEFHPRMFTANSGPGGDMGHYFEKFGHHDVAAFVRKDYARMNNIDDADLLGTFRRMIIFNPTRQQIGFRTASIAAQGQVNYQEEITRRQAFLDTLDA